MPPVAQAACATGIGWAVLNKRPDYLSDLRGAATAPIFAVGSTRNPPVSYKSFDGEDKAFC